MQISTRSTAVTMILALAVLLASSAQAQLPVQGKRVPQLADFDDLMQTYMDDNGLNAGVLGIMKDHRIVYLRGFGYKDEAHSIDLPENAMMRVASVTKPVTAASIRKLIEWGTIGRYQRVFQEVPGDGGILDYEPWGGVAADSRIYEITVDHLLRHRGGWDRSEPVGDLTYREVDIAEEMGFDPYRVPTRKETVQWIMGEVLQFDPGSQRAYSNVGYLILGLIAEQESGESLNRFCREHVLDESMWFPASEFEPGRTYAEFQNPREPWYDNNGFMAEDVFHPDGDPVPAPYGQWNHEARLGQGGLICSTVPLLNFLDTYYINGDYIGGPLPGSVVTDMDHKGRLRGTECLARQLASGVNYVIILNQRIPEDPPDPEPSFMYVAELQIEIDAMISAGGINWPTQEVDGVWIDLMYDGPEQGTYDEPFDNIQDLNQLMTYSKVRFKAGSTPWTGVLDQAYLALSAPEGSMVFGE